MIEKKKAGSASCCLLTLDCMKVTFVGHCEKTSLFPLSMLLAFAPPHLMA